ncbi:MAG: hypothetical protein WD273_04825 [Trueperaceae bacterium]
MLRLFRVLRRALLVALLGACAPAVGERGAIPVSDSVSVRRSQLNRWHQLGEQGITGLDRFAQTVQYVVDSRAQMNQSGREVVVRSILDDLVDLFVGPRFHLEKSLIMSTAPVLGEDALTEQSGDLEGFAPKFQEGEGRFRHFALNAAAAYAAPDALVELAARIRGGDMPARSPDSVADLATNRVGRRFTRMLREQSLSELADGVSVRDWLVEQFGSP